eukprot:757002-Hanusia_phi.AAC.6
MDPSKHQDLFNAVADALHDVCRSSEDVEVARWVHDNKERPSDLVNQPHALRLTSRERLKTELFPCRRALAERLRGHCEPLRRNSPRPSIILTAINNFESREQGVCLKQHPSHS